AMKNKDKTIQRNADYKLTLISADEQTRVLELHQSLQENPAELPPLPPNGIFDARFIDNSNSADLTKSNTIIISGAQFPVKLRVDGNGFIKLKVTDAIDGNQFNGELTNSDELVLMNPAITSLIITKLSAVNQYSLEQNYPNPFNPITTIKYSIPEDGYVSLSVFDILGNEVQKLVSENQKAGSYKVEFDGSTLASGVYFYKLKVNNFNSINKMILIK
ncbi:MAG: T9SS type A sorting domain-containing protein, partial [Ignavibacteria bacterium]|nr:T9SS type A sorting domain-containing protein [Ignavibacteria bacterium]